ncbi:hypothetical protein [Laceyella sacchari]|uniref:Uncharacterized protein n=1 Tax=Laceyella sacchari TaxID=37482 RepID=A0ABY5U2Y5_LACSH|nr:hypothetical protein [Laceyella sacchari]UWE04001.1 hypothetical protein NYR52_02205 [Laceyella sacchari]
MLSFFGVGEIYRNGYRVEHVVKFFDGELAVARKDDQRYYLQSAMLQKQAPSRAIQQYRTLHHPLVLPYEEVYTEERSIVFIRPYEAIHPLREVISSREVDEDQVVEWGRQLLSLEIELKSKPMPMYLLLDPRNIGLNDQDELRVLFCGLEQITAQSRTLDWGSFFFSLLSGQYLEEPLEKMPADFPCSKPMSKLIQRSLKKQSPESVLSQIDAYKKKQKQGGGFFDFLFGSTKEETKPRPKKVEEQAAKEQPVPKQQKDEEPFSVTETPVAPVDNKEQQQNYDRLEEERLEQLRLEFERRQEELLRKQREELERKQQELLEKQRKEFEQKERELLAKQKEEFKQRITEPEEQESWEREQEEKERLEQEKKEQERLEQERIEQERLEQERKEQERLEEERRAWEQRERERIEKEQEDRVQAELEKLKQERLEWEKKRQELERKEEELKERLQKEFEELAQKLLKKQEEEFQRRQEEMLKAQRELLESKTKERLEKQREELEQTSKRYLITPQHTKPRASLFDLLPKDHQLKGKPQSEAEPTPPAEEQPKPVDPQPPIAESKQEKEKQGTEEKASLRQEKLERESQEQDQLALQFEEYMKQMMGDES